MSALPGYLVVVDASVDPEVEDDWNRWYTEIHMPDALKCPGFRHGARYVSGEEDRHYLAVYEIESPWALETAEFAGIRGWGVFKGRVKSSLRLYRRIGSEVK